MLLGNAFDTSSRPVSLLSLSHVAQTLLMTFLTGTCMIFVKEWVLHQQSYLPEDYLSLFGGTHRKS